jgi:hypothetical protein
MAAPAAPCADRIIELIARQLEREALGEAQFLAGNGAATADTAIIAAVAALNRAAIYLDQRRRK